MLQIWMQMEGWSWLGRFCSTGQEPPWLLAALKQLDVLSSASLELKAINGWRLPKLRLRSSCPHPNYASDLSGTNKTKKHKRKDEAKTYFSYDEWEKKDHYNSDCRTLDATNESHLSELDDELHVEIESVILLINRHPSKFKMATPWSWVEGSGERRRELEWRSEEINFWNNFLPLCYGTWRLLWLGRQ